MPFTAHTHGMKRRAVGAPLTVTARAAGKVLPLSVESWTTTLSLVAEVFCAYAT